MSKPEPKTKYLNYEDLKARYHVGRNWVERRIRHSRFPKPVRLGAGRLRFWLEADVDTWDAEQRNHPRPNTNVG